MATLGKEFFQNRIELLTNERAKLQQQIAQMGANVSAYNGAIEEDKFAIAQIEAMEATEPKEGEVLPPAE